MAMKITDLKVYVVDPAGNSAYDRPWTFVRVDTDDGISGYGESTNDPGKGCLIVADAIRHLKEFIVGEDPRDIIRLWHKLFRKTTYLGSRGLPTAVISG